ncbi:type IV pilus biogenesis protein PilM [Buttiauxella sp. A111]|uniref:type IV pilus biogenesis protein PilM n=1 Tax=Buttiauxella sp. A111 TaxID=2563088 RepID=UPI00161C268F|nr:pilus assembly protein PilM [Buttiauxella sp. A111]
MMFATWQIGLDIQHTSVRAVAVQRQRQGWQLRHWWQLPLPEGTFRDGLLMNTEAFANALLDWRKELPVRHQLRVSFPTQRTLQRPIPAPDKRLAESASDAYIASTTARQLQMTPAQLCWDYLASQDVADPYLIVAARQTDVAALIKSLAVVKLFPATLTPGASALPALTTPCHLEKCEYLVHREENHWLWASTETTPRWGWADTHVVPTISDLCQQLKTEPGKVALSFAQPESQPVGFLPLDAWSALSRLQPPLPRHGGVFTVAIGLAIGRVSR